MKQKIFFFEKKIKNGRLKKKIEIFKIANSLKSFLEISQIGPWVSELIDGKGIDVAQLIRP